MSPVDLVPPVNWVSPVVEDLEPDEHEPDIEMDGLSYEDMGLNPQSLSPVSPPDPVVVYNEDISSEGKHEVFNPKQICVASDKGPFSCPNGSGSHDLNEGNDLEEVMFAVVSPSKEQVNPE